MKTINNFRQYIPVLLLATILVASTVETNAQRSYIKTRGNERKEYKSSDKYDKKLAHHEWKENHGKESWRKDEYQARYYSDVKYDKSDYFTHPKYGRVYNRFDHNPIVFNHDKDDYYYYGNHFYTYRRGVGYCMAEPPRRVYFKHLPVECNRVNLNGQVFFSSGDLFFQLSSRGYVLVPSPVGIRITARF